MPPEEPLSGGSGAAAGDPAAAPAAAAVSSDRLAAQLMECAILVKKGERGPLLRKTIHDLTDYLTNVNFGAAPPPPPESSPAGSSLSAAAAAPSPPRAGAASDPPSSLGNLSATSTSSQVSKHQHKAPPFIAGLGKMMGLTDDYHPHTGRSAAAEGRAAATSAKNAHRIRAEVTSHSDWCEEHFTMGCACKTRRAAAAAGNQESAPQQAPAQQPPQPARVPGVATAVARPVGSAHPNQQPQPQQPRPNQQHHPGAVSASASYTSASNRDRVKPPFQRPSNPSSSLIANGWIEQQRRSKMRVVWKDVLASLVEGRRRGEETTLWIQREVTHERTGHVELEALHQIPVKLIEQVHYQPSYAGEPQKFVIRAYNTAEEYIFRCRDEEAAQNWVLTLRSVQQLVQQRRAGAVRTGVDDWERERVTSPAAPAAGAQPQPPQAHHPHQARSPPLPTAAPPPDVRRVVSEEEKKAEHPPHAAQAEGMQHPQQQQHRMTVTELRAIALGAGYNTHGMERGELEQLVSQIAAAAAPGAKKPSPAAQPPAASGDPKPPQAAEDEELLRRRRQAEEMEKRRQMEEARRRKEAEEHRRRQQSEEEAAAKRGAEAEKQKQQEEERARVLAERVREQQAAEKKRLEEEERRRLAEERQRRDEEELRRRAAEKQAAEERRKQEEAQKAQQQQWQQQQQAWQKQQAEEEQRRRAAEAQAAEVRRQQEEAYRRQQQWHQQQQQQHPQYTPPQGSQPHQQPRPPQPQQGYQQQQHPPNAQYPGAGAAHPPGGHPQSPPPTQGSAVNMKYAKMAQQSDDGAVIWNIKHGILVQWALLPPMMQVLRPIEDLLTTIHKVYPPQFGVPGHEYFSKFAAITHEEITVNHRLDDAKLKKAMRKLRFFLHPDKLPRDLSKEQSFMCKMLWDIISDAEAEHKKKEEELGWIRG